MATSGSTDFTQNRDDVIKRALRIAGAYAQGETPEADDVAEASVALNTMLKSWDADGLHLWNRTEVIVPMTAGGQSYKLGPSGDVDTTRPLHIIYAFRRDVSSGRDTEMQRMSMEEYWRLSDKDSNGIPTQYAFDPQLGNSVVYVWPVESTASRTNVHLQCEMPAEDMDAAGNTFDYPVEWLDTLAWGLAAELVFEYSQDLQYCVLVVQRAEEKKRKLLMWDVEDAPLKIKPAPRLLWRR